MGKQSKAYTEGYAAYPDRTNPYEAETYYYNDWNDGFAAARHDEQTTQTGNNDDDDIDDVNEGGYDYFGDGDEL